MDYVSNPRIYDSIGAGYAQRRKEDPKLKARILEALGDAKTIVNVGAGAGSYEPHDRIVIPVEPSAVMSAQRAVGGIPAIRATADALPLHDQSVDGAMAILSVHHWAPLQKEGVRELLRVARNQIAILTIDPRVSGAMWLMADYLREVAELDHVIFPLPETIAAWLGAGTQIEVIPIHRDISDGMLLSFWAHPERVLDPAARAATSGFARQPEHVIERVTTDIARDLKNGSWDARYGSLRQLNEYDAGLRLVHRAL